MKDMEIKICIVSSITPKNSSLDFLLNKLLAKLKIEFNVCENKYIIDNHYLQCEGCKNCFKKGRCQLDDKDEFKIVRQNIERSDLIIIATPIYANNVSSSIKLFFDRISYWMHFMKLLGKSCIIVVSGGYTGLDYVSNYLYECCSALGMNILGIVSKQTNKNKVIVDYEIDFVCENLKYLLFYNRSMFINTLEEYTFSGYKTIYNINRPIRDQAHLEYEYWSSMPYDGICEYLNNKKEKEIIV